MSIEISTVSLLLLANAALLAIATVTLLRFQRAARAHREFWQSPTGAALDAEPAGQPQDTGKPAERRDCLQSMMRLERQMLLLRKDFHRSLASASEAGREPRRAAVLPFENAARMAKHGASADELSARCGLSTEEARLMLKLHRSPPTRH